MGIGSLLTKGLKSAGKAATKATKKVAGVASTAMKKTASAASKLKSSTKNAKSALQNALTNKNNKISNATSEVSAAKTQSNTKASNLSSAANQHAKNAGAKVDQRAAADKKLVQNQQERKNLTASQRGDLMEDSPKSTKKVDPTKQQIKELNNDKKVESVRMKNENALALQNQKQRQKLEAQQNKFERKQADSTDPGVTDARAANQQKWAEKTGAGLSVHQKNQLKWAQNRQDKRAQKLIKQGINPDTLQPYAPTQMSNGQMLLHNGTVVGTPTPTYVNGFGTANGHMPAGTAGGINIVTGSGGDGGGGGSSNFMGDMLKYQLISGAMNTGSQVASGAISSGIDYAINKNEEKNQPNNAGGKDQQANDEGTSNPSTYPSYPTTTPGSTTSPSHTTPGGVGVNINYTPTYNITWSGSTQGSGSSSSAKPDAAGTTSQPTNKKDSPTNSNDTMGVWGTGTNSSGWLV